MDKQNALKLLGLGNAASPDEIQAALKAKKQDIADKKANAPTEALKAKFESLEEKLAEAEEVLSADPGNSEPVGDNSTGSEETKQTSPSPLSQTKLADLPGLAPQDAAQVELQPGQIIASRYEIKELIGQGGMGAVYRAFDKNRDEDIAIKVLLPSLTKNERALERFLNEARISSKLSHQNIVNVFDVQNDGDLYFLIMELLEGQDLAQLIQTREQLNQPFTAKELVEVIEQLAPALDYAHQHTVHRDIKPENVWLDEDGYYKLMDFGIAQLQSTSQRTQTGAAMGTAYYMAPEQLKGSKNVDARADIYALGVMLYTMATGDVPAGLIKPLHEKRPDISPAFSNAVMQCLEADPTDRPQSANDLLTLLQQGLAAKGRKIKKGATSKSSRPTSAGHLHGGGSNKLVIAAVLLLIVGVGGAVGTGMLDLSGLLPMSKEERRALQADAVRLQGQVDTLARRLEDARRKLESELRDAERNSSDELPALQRWHEAVERNLFGGSLMSELAGERAVAEAVLRDKEYRSATESFGKVRDGYDATLREFEAASGLHNSHKQAEYALSKWKNWSSDFGIQGIPQQREIELRLEQVVKNEEDGEFRRAASGYREVAKDFESLFETAQPIENAMAAVDEAASQWKSIKAKHNPPDPEFIQKAKSAYAKYKEHSEAGDLQKAIGFLNESKGYYVASVKSKDVNRHIINKKRNALLKQRNELEIKLKQIDIQLGKLPDMTNFKYRHDEMRRELDDYRDQERSLYYSIKNKRDNVRKVCVFRRIRDGENINQNYCMKQERDRINNSNEAYNLEVVRGNLKRAKETYDENAEVLKKHEQVFSQLQRSREMLSSQISGIDRQLNSIN